MTPTAITTPPYWQQPSFAMPTLHSEVHADTCVVGLGGSGLAAIHALLEAGQSVIGIDAAGLASGAAGRNGGFLVSGAALFHHVASRRYGPRWAFQLYDLTRTQLQRMKRETPHCIELSFAIRRAADDIEVDDCREELSAFERDGIDADWFDGPQGVGLKIFGEGVFHPHRRALALARTAVAHGARLYVNTPALDVKNGEIRTPNGLIRCRSVIVAVDGGLTKIFPELCDRVTTVRLQMLATEPDPYLRLEGPVYSRYAHDYWQQRPDGQILLGGGRDLAGAAELCSEETVTELIQDYLTTVLRSDIGTQARITHRWAGIVSYTEDELPILEEVRPGVIAAGAYSGTGNVLGAVAGRDAAAWVTGRPTPLRALIDEARRHAVPASLKTAC